jgi:hypothetical protein
MKRRPQQLQTEGASKWNQVSQIVPSFAYDHSKPVKARVPGKLLNVSTDVVTQEI